jgi:hypothetical protein
VSRWGCRRCDWAPDEMIARPADQLDAHAATTGHPTCVMCRISLPHEQPQACLPCISTVRQGLDQIARTWPLLPGLLGRLRSGSDWRQSSSRSPQGDETPLPGGDALVLLCGGSEGAEWARGSKGVATATINDNLPTDPPSVAFELGRHEDDWRAYRREPAASGLPAVDDALAYLAPRVTWAAAAHPAFAGFAADIATLAARLAQVTGTVDRPETGAPCMECGAYLERGWTECGLADDWVCPRCHQSYPDAAYWLAVRAGLEAERERAEAVGT